MPGIASQRADRCVVDDRAVALTLHLPKLVLHATPDATQIDADDTVPLVPAGVGDGRDPRHHARIVERGVESAKLGDGAFDHSRHVRVVTHIATDGECLDDQRRELLCFSADRVFADVRQHNRRARLGEGSRRREPHARGGPGDEGDLAGEVQGIGHQDSFAAEGLSEEGRELVPRDQVHAVVEIDMSRARNNEEFLRFRRLV